LLNDVLTYRLDHRSERASEGIHHSPRALTYGP
jgi:hypothetical protein